MGILGTSPGEECPLIAINSTLIFALGLLYLFAKPAERRRRSKGPLALAGIVVAAMAGYFATRLWIGFAVLFVALAVAVLVKVVLNLRAAEPSPAAAEGQTSQTDPTWQREQP